MTRKRCHRRIVTPLPPRGMRPRLTSDQRLELSLVHHVNLDTIARGAGDESTLWEVVGGVLTWSRVAEKLSAGVDQMTLQLALTTRLVDHYRATGRIEFAGDDYELAKDGVVVMDLLADQVDRATALEAATWSEHTTRRMAHDITGRLS